MERAVFNQGEFEMISLLVKQFEYGDLKIWSYFDMGMIGCVDNRIWSNLDLDLIDLQSVVYIIEFSL